MITCDVIEPIHDDVEEPTRQEKYNRQRKQKMKKFIVHTIESAPEKSSPTLRGMQEKFGFLPNVMGTMAENPVLLNGFAASFGSFHGGSFEGGEKQGLALTTRCP